MLYQLFNLDRFLLVPIKRIASDGGLALLLDLSCVDYFALPQHQEQSHVGVHPGLVILQG